MRILLTGAGGFLGRKILEKWSDEFQILGTYYSRPFERPPATIRRLDIRDRHAVMSLVIEFQPDWIVHTAYDYNDPTGVIVSGTEHVADAARQAGCRILLISTDMVFPGGGSYVESDKPDPITAYGRAKVAAESAVEKSGAGLIARTSLLYDENVMPPHFGFIREGISKAEPVSLFVDEIRTPILIGDLSDALTSMIRKGSSGLYHVAGPRKINRFDFGVRMARHFGLNTSVLRKASIRDFPGNRPGDVSLDSSRATSEFGLSIRSVDAALNCEE